MTFLRSIGGGNFFIFLGQTEALPSDSRSAAVPGALRSGVASVSVLQPGEISEVIGAAARGLEHYPPRIPVRAEVQKSVVAFLVDRARYILLERHGFAYDEGNAVLATGADDLVDVLARVAALREIRKTRNFEPLAVSFKRIRKILEKAAPQESWQLSGVRPELFQEDAERALHASAHRVAREAEQHKRAGRYLEALQDIARLRSEVDGFFDRVLVMAEQEDVRRNRLTLLAGLLREFSTIADFSEIVTVEK